MPPPTPEQEHEWLLQAQRDRNPHAFAQLVNLHQGKVRAVLRQLTHGQQALADDLAQETFIQAWRALPSFRMEAQWGTWLYRIAYREFLQHCRRQADATDHANVEDWTSTNSYSASTDPCHELRLDLAQALTHLHPLETAAIVHCYHAGLTHIQAAEVMGMPLGTLKSHLTRGRAKLKVLLAAWKPVDAP